MDTARTRKNGLVIFCALGLLLYAYGVASARYIPVHIEGVALPLDFMVGIPLGFYLLVVRPRKLTLLAVIPVIWMGYALSVVALGSPEAGILPYLLSVLVPVELAIAVREVRKIVGVYRSAKESSDDPMAWFKDTMRYLVRKDMPASMTAAELSVWYYALLSWRKKPYVLPGEKAFSYHNAGGYMNMMLGLALAFPVEIVGVHMLVSQWSIAAAFAVTLSRSTRSCGSRAMQGPASCGPSQSAPTTFAWNAAFRCTPRFRSLKSKRSASPRTTSEISRNRTGSTMGRSTKRTSGSCRSVLLRFAPCSARSKCESSA